jgi:hypothetical protein
MLVQARKAGNVGFSNHSPRKRLMSAFHPLLTLVDVCFLPLQTLAQPT